MSATATVYMQCDKCGEDESVDLSGPQEIGSTGPTNIEEAIEAEGWEWTGPRLDQLLCADCADEADEADG